MEAKCGGAWMVRPKFQPSKLKGSTGLCQTHRWREGFQFLGDFLLWKPQIRNRPKCDIVSSTPGGWRQRDMWRWGQQACVRTRADHQRGCSTQTWLSGPLKEQFLHLLHDTFGRRSILWIGASLFTPFFALIALLAVKVRKVILSICSPCVNVSADRSKRRNCTPSRSAWRLTSRTDLSPSAPFVVGMATAGGILLRLFGWLFGANLKEGKPLISNLHG